MPHGRRNAIISEFLTDQRVLCGDRYAVVRRCPHGAKYYALYQQPARMKGDHMRPAALDWQQEYAKCCVGSGGA